MKRVENQQEFVLDPAKGCDSDSWRDSFCSEDLEYLPDWLEGRLREDVVGVFGLVDEDRNHEGAFVITSTPFNPKCWAEARRWRSFVWISAKPFSRAQIRCKASAERRKTDVGNVR